MSYGLGLIDYNFNNGLGANGAAIANNGLSIFGGTTVVLGGPAGAASAANLLRNSEIPLNNFQLIFSGIGQSATAVPIFKESATMVNLGSTPDYLIQDSTGAEQGRVRFNGSVAGDAGDMYFGRLAGSLMTTPDSRMFFGWRTGELTTAGTALASTAFGYESLRLVTGNNNNAFGSQALHNITTGADNIGVGKNTMLFQTISNRSIAIGNSAGPQFAAQSFDDNIWIGNAAGISGSSTSFVATQNVIIGSGALSTGGGGYGNANVVIGYLALQTGAQGANNVVIGAGTIGTASFSNSVMIGQGLSNGISNIVQLGRADQNVIIGVTTGPVDQATQLQIRGNIGTVQRNSAVNTTFNLKTDQVLTLSAGALTITIPAAAAANGGAYVWVVNEAAASNFSQNYLNFAGALVTTIPANSAIVLQSNGGGATWVRIL